MNIFNSIPLLRPKRNTFNLGEENKLTTDFGRLVPFMVKEALPDDVFKLRAEVFCRVSPMIAPVMHRFNIRYYYFFVPNRLLWDDFEKWINPKTGVSELVSPRIKIEGDGFHFLAPKTLADYLGVNVGLAPEDQAVPATTFAQRCQAIFPEGLEVSALPFRAYQKIYNDWFIDLNNNDPLEFSTEGGVEVLDTDDISDPLYNALMKLRYRCWEHDYFTSAMPDAQRGPEVYAFEGTDPADLEIKGDGYYQSDQSFIVFNAGQLDSSVFTFTDAVVPQGGAQIYTNLRVLLGNNYALYGFSDANAARTWFDNNIAYLSSLPVSGDVSKLTTPGGQGSEATKNHPFVRVAINGTDYDFPVQLTNPSPKSSSQMYISTDELSGKLRVQLKSGVTAPGVTVEELRTRMQMQSFLERNEIGGSRYTEMLYAHWGVKSQDGRLQRSEFIGGGKQPILINDVSQTSAPTDEDPLGQYAGQGLSSGMSRAIRYRAPEHGFIIGLCCIVPRTGYFQGLHKMWKRFDRLDYYWPSFAHLGEQEVKNHEIMNTGFDPDGTFGYQSRYAEYKTGLDSVHGDFKGNLAFYHDARVFGTPVDAQGLPKLSGNFTEISETSDDLDRIFPVLNSVVPWYNADHFLLDIYSHCIASRRMPKFVTPRNGS